MLCRLIPPDGVRLAHLDELLGPDARRVELWQRIQSASISPGVCVRASGDPRFAIYAEANVDAPQIWNIFEALCRALVGPAASLLVGHIDGDPSCVGPAHTSSLLQLLKAHRYQLTNDGWIQFGLLEKRDASIVEVIVAPTKHFQVWASDEAALRSVFAGYGISETDQLQFLDEFPRVTVRLQDKRVVSPSSEELVHFLCDSVRGLS